MAVPPGNMNMEQMLAALSGKGVSQLPSLPLQRPIVPGVLPQGTQGNSNPAINVNEILQLMAAPKLRAK